VPRASSRDRHRRDASCTDGRTTDTPRDNDPIASGAESAKPQVNGDVGGARGGIRTPDLPITSQLHYMFIGALWCRLMPLCTILARCWCWAVTARDCEYRDGRIHHGRTSAAPKRSHGAVDPPSDGGQTRGWGRLDHSATRVHHADGAIDDPYNEPVRSRRGSNRAGRRLVPDVGDAGDFTDRSGVSPRVPYHPRLAPIIAGDVHKRPADSLGRHPASLPVPLRPARPCVGRSEGGAKSGRQSPVLYGASDGDRTIMGLHN
jgi:hypothetical protein